MVKHTSLLSTSAIVLCTGFMTIGQHVCDGFTSTSSAAFVGGSSFNGSGTVHSNKQKTSFMGPLHAYAMDQEDFDASQRNDQRERTFRSNSMKKSTSSNVDAAQDPSAAYITNEIITVNESDLPRFVDLPMKRNNNRPRSRYAADIPEDGTLAAEAEMIVGRMAMVAAVAFFLGEFMTGESIAQQVTELL